MAELLMDLCHDADGLYEGQGWIGCQTTEFNYWQREHGNWHCTGSHHLGSTVILCTCSCHRKQTVKNTQSGLWETAL